MASKLLSGLVAGALLLSSTAVVSQTAPEPAVDSSLGSQGESALTGGNPEAVTAIIFGLIVIVIAIWVNRDNGGEPEPESP